MYLVFIFWTKVFFSNSNLSNIFQNGIDNCSKLFQAYKPQDAVARKIQYGLAFEESKRLNMKFANEEAMTNNIKYMRTMVTAKCFNNGLTGQKLKAKNQLKEYQKIVYDVIATDFLNCRNKVR